MGTSAGLSQTLQFITSIKLQEREKQRLSHQEHAKILLEADAVGDDLVKKCEILIKAVESWKGSGSITSYTSLGGKLTTENLHLWIESLETHIRHSLMRFDCAKLFGSLFNEWLSSRATGDAQSTRPPHLIFDEKHIDTAALESYLAKLFSGDEASKALGTLRKDLERFGSELKRKTISPTNVQDSIHGLSASGLMDEGKRATLAEFLENATVVEEVASVLNMDMASLESWSWPAEGLAIEMRPFTDPDIVDALLLQYIGIAWQVKLKAGFKRILESKAWRHSHPDLSPALHERNSHQILGVAPEHTNAYPAAGIEHSRRKDREEHLFLGQLSSLANKPSTYDDLLDAPTGTTPDSPAAIKQKLLHIMTTECQLNSTVHGSHAAILSDLEWFGPSLPHASILTILKFFGIPSDWCSFFERFLAAPLRFKQDPEDQPRIRKRGTPISYAISVLCGEAVLFGMDFAVNQRTDGLFLYRMHDDLWLWNANAEKCAVGWKEMNVYADHVGLKFNDLKTGSAYVGKGEPTGLPVGEVRWGLLRFDKDAASFVIDQKDVDTHIAELRRQLASTKSVFGWMNAYKKYMAFFHRNFGGRPAACFGDAHTADIIATLARIQRELFPDIEGGAVAYLRSVIKTRFGISDLPQGYFYLPISSGGLELHHPMIDMFALKKQTDSDGKPQSFKALVEGGDQAKYKEMKEIWENGPSHHGGVAKRPYMDFDEYLAL
ncbi:hypothetical protein H0H81_007371 [Sphagnurus paluster]|uniref:Reverse transcriptase domain-containing protein n=1 Tax=Sphagnurus paluster TaxID=117069 RepID=A0A9P7K570_9AGAR|nr:hypothetical protein H0H81_007371 [Sphagnurus paluster]